VAIQAFSSAGYEGVSVRDIERRANVTRNLVGHHFGSKQGLWEAAMDSLMAEFRAGLAPLAITLTAVSAAERPRVALKVIVQHMANHLDLFRMLILLAGERSERAEWFMTRHVRPSVAFFGELAGRPSDNPGDGQTFSFLAVSAAATVCAVISMPYFFEGLFNIELESETGVRRFIEVVTDFFAGQLATSTVTFSS
jgi:AcrR family transcriptional regulator